MNRAQITEVSDHMQDAIDHVEEAFCISGREDLLAIIQTLFAAANLKQ